MTTTHLCLTALIAALYLVQGVTAQAPTSPFGPLETGTDLAIGQVPINLIADLNNDGRDDVISNGYNFIAWQLSGADGLPGTAQGIVVPFNDILQLSGTADVDRDGNLDLLLSTMDTNFVVTLEIHYGDGAGAFPRVEHLPVPPLVIAAAPGLLDIEVSPNGSAEILIVVRASITTDFNTYTAYRDDVTGTWSHTPSGQFREPVDRQAFFYANQRADLDGDGYDDLVSVGRTIANGGGSHTHIVIWRGIPQAPGFDLNPIYIPRAPPGYVYPRQVYPFVADQNGDGLADIVMVEPLGRWPVNQIWGIPADARVFTAFGDAQTLVGPWNSGTDINNYYTSLSRIRIADFDGDGISDLVSPTHPNPPTVDPSLEPHIEFSRGHADGTFAAPTVVPAGHQAFQVFFPADTDGDGDLDLVSNVPTYVSVLRNRAFSGAGTNSHLGFPPRVVRQDARVGDLGFQLKLEDAPPGVPVVLGLSLQTMTPNSDGIGIDLLSLLRPLSFFGPGMTTAQGTASHTLALPHPSLAGVKAYAQWAVGSFTSPGFAVSTVARYQVMP